MPRLAELLHQERTRLEDFAHHIKERLRTEFAYITDEDREDPVYVIKSRVKSYRSLEHKLYKRLERPELSQAERNQCRRLLHENLVSLSEVLSVIHDLVGVRVVWFFEQAKQDAAARMIEQQSAHWFSLSQEGGIYRVRVLPAHDNVDLVPSLRPFKRPVEDTRYTSIHLIGSLSPRSDLHKKFSDLSCELQFRTLFEEAWSEISHYLDYKGVRVKESKQALDGAKIHLIPIENDFRLLSDKTKRLRSRRLHPYLQLAQHYPINSYGSLPPNWISDYERAYQLRVEGDFQRSIDLLKDTKERVPTSVSPEHVDRLTRRILCDIAVCLMHDNQFVAARDSIVEAKRCGNDGPRAFWANLREAELHRQAGEYSSAILSCEAALRRLAERREHMWCSTVGLEADVVCYLSFVRWSEAYHLYSKVYDRSPTPRVEFLSAAEQVHSDAIDIARKAYQMVMNATDSSPELRVRASSSLMHLLVWKQSNDPQVASLFREVLDIGHHTPSDLGKLAWALLTGAAGDGDRAAIVAEAKRFCDEGLELTNSQPPKIKQRICNRLNVLQLLVDDSLNKSLRIIQPCEWFSFSKL